MIKTSQIFSNILRVSLIACIPMSLNIANASSVEKGFIGVEVVEKEEVTGNEPKCKIHFQFISGVDQTAKAQITSYQVLDTEKLTFGMTGKKTVKPNSRSYVSKITSRNACNDVLKIAVDRSTCDFIDDNKSVTGSCNDKLTLIDNSLVIFIDKRN